MSVTRTPTLIATVLLALAPAGAPQAGAVHGAAPARPGSPARPEPAAWVARSNRNAQVLLDVLGRLSPEAAGQLGVTGLDDQILDLRPGFRDRARKEVEKALGELRARLAREDDPAVRQDLGILIERAERSLEGADLTERLLLPYFDLHQTVFQGLRSLLDDQVGAARRPAALVRLNKYAGLEKGYEPITTLATARTRERLAATGLLGPARAEVERDLANAPTFVKGIRTLFEKYHIAGYAPAYARLQGQLADYEAFLRNEILPRARTDFRQPEALYAYALKQYGIDMPVPDLVSRAQVEFFEIRAAMQALAPLVAKERGLVGSDGQPLTDYRDVIRALKTKQLAADAILAHYQARIRDLEDLIRSHHVVTLPDRPMRIEIASEADTAVIPAPHLQPPRLVDNTGEMGTFVLPLRAPGASGEAKAMDDFTFEAASWTLTAHEGRPGHDLQFAAMVEDGVSLARAIFAFNSVNVEGWGLYAEAIMTPLLPLDGQLIALQERMMRAARAFLDPGLQLGTTTRDEAMRVLREDVVLSEPMALQEVERYTFRSPGQAPAYFCGYTRLLEIRAAAEAKMGPRFDQLKFHDFVLAQGLLPPALLRKAVLEDFAK